MAEEERDPERWERIARYLAGEATLEERAELESWLAEEPARAELVGQLGAAVARTAAAPRADLDVEAALARVHQLLDADPVLAIESARGRRQRPRWQFTPLRAAAAAAFLLLGATVLYRVLLPGWQPVAGPVAALTHETPIGRTDTLSLADGSMVVLAPASRLFVPEGYGEAARRVVLEGVAWFEVRPGDRAFTVRAGDALITDLGTAFTVRADSALPVRVTVTEGSVSLASNAAGASGVILNAGQSGSFAGGVATAEPGAADPEGALAWTRGRLIFTDAPFAQVAAELRRWYGVRLLAGDSALAARHLTAEFAGEAVAEVIAVLTLALDARSEARGDTIILRSVR